MYDCIIRTECLIFINCVEKNNSAKFTRQAAKYFLRPSFSLNAVNRPRLLIFVRNSVTGKTGGMLQEHVLSFFH